MIKMRAKLLLATVQYDCTDAEDAIVVRRGSKGTQYYSTMETDKTVAMLHEMGVVLCEAPRKARHDA